MKRVLVLMHTWAGYMHGVQQGIAEYLVQRPDWIWTRMLPQGPDYVRILSQMRFDGVIAYMEPEHHDVLRTMGCPVVDVSNWLPADAAFPRVLPDDIAIGRMAAKYLMDLGLRHFGCVGLVGPIFSDLRRSSFSEAVTAGGGTVQCADHGRYELPPGIEVPAGIDPALAAWLMQLPRPCGIFATLDGAAADVVNTCRHLRIRVPEELCVLGVDNDDLTSKFTHPALSSIELPTQKIGFEAARLLDQLMAGGPRPDKPTCLPPVGVVTRQSTSVLAIPDEDVMIAIRYIREHVHEGITVEDVLNEVPVNRRYLERRFKEHIGRSPLQEIRRVRLEKAKELLSGTDLSMPAVAKRSGFPNPERLANVFHEQVGETPTDYRRKFRLRDES